MTELARADTPAQALAWCAAARDGDRRALAKLTSLFERDDPAAWPVRAACMAQMQAAGATPRAVAPLAKIVALTGAPGVGKSSLVGALLTHAMSKSVRDVAGTGPRIGVIAVDPASQASGGALLADRTRIMGIAGAPHAMFRSQSSQGALGGIADATASVARLWAHVLDVVFIETVGVGQSESDVATLATATWLVLQPGAGDHLQFLKAGLMERADCFVLNKVDMPHAAVTKSQLAGAVRLTATGAAPRPVHAVSARTNEGIAALWGELTGVARATSASLEGEVLRRWCERELGRSAAQILADNGGARAWAERAGGAEAAWLGRVKGS